jgi:hypothetical protein
MNRKGCSKTFIHDGDSYQLMTMNKKWKRFQKVGESHLRGMKGIDYTSRYHLFKTCWKKDQVQRHVNFRKMSECFQKVACVHNNCARFEECQCKGVRGVDYTK